MVFFLHYLPWKTLNVFTSFKEDRQPVMTIEHGSVGSDLQGARLTGLQ